MKYFFIVLLGFIFSVGVSGQEVKKDKPDINTVKSKMVLRPNTRDKKATIHDNLKRMQVQKRHKKQISIQQQKIMKRRQGQIQKSRMHRQRMIQQRRTRQHAVQRRQMHRR